MDEEAEVPPDVVLQKVCHKRVRSVSKVCQRVSEVCQKCVESTNEHLLLLLHERVQRSEGLPGPHLELAQDSDEARGTCSSDGAPLAREQPAIRTSDACQLAAWPFRDRSLDNAFTNSSAFFDFQNFFPML